MSNDHRMGWAPLAALLHSDDTPTPAPAGPLAAPAAPTPAPAPAGATTPDEAQAIIHAIKALPPEKVLEVLSGLGFVAALPASVIEHHSRPAQMELGLEIPKGMLRAGSVIKAADTYSIAGGEYGSYVGNRASILAYDDVEEEKQANADYGLSMKLAFQAEHSNTAASLDQMKSMTGRTTVAGYADEQIAPPAQFVPAPYEVVSHTLDEMGAVGCVRRAYDWSRCLTVTSRIGLSKNRSEFDIRTLRTWDGRALGPIPEGAIATCYAENLLGTVVDFTTVTGKVIRGTIDYVAWSAADSTLTHIEMVSPSAE